jgi:YVTN family beta-propeller protein
MVAWLDVNEGSSSGRSDLPSGTVTFLFTDIEGSTRLERELRDRYSEVLTEHQRLLRAAFERYGGREVDTQGDSFFFVFAGARDAVAAAVEAQRLLASHPWPEERQVRVRIGMHTGEASLSDGRYVGLAVHRAARISAAGHGGQILLSGSTRDVVEDDLPPDQRLRELGEQRLKDLPRPERVFQLVADGLAGDFPPLKTLEEQELAEAAQAVLAPPWWRRSRVVLPLAAAVAGAAILIGVALVQGGGEAGATEVRANALGLIAPDSGNVDGEIAVDAAPTGVARSEDAVWVTNAHDGTVSRIDPLTRSIRQTIEVGDSPSGIAVGAGSIWVANHADSTVSRINPETNTVVHTIDVGNGPLAVAFGEGSVWVTNSLDRSASRIDPGSGDVIKTIETDAVGRGIVVGGGSVWITDESSSRVARIDPATNSVAETISVGNGPSGITFGKGAIWVANALDGTVSRIDPARGTVTATVPVPGGPAAVAVAGDDVWVSAEFAERLVRIDAVKGTIVDEVTIGNRPKGVVVADDGVWVAVQASGRGHRGGRLVVAPVEIDSIDPALANVPESREVVLSMVHDGLTGFRRVGGSEGTQPVPNLAVSIPTPRDGGRTYTFRLRRGLRYANGRVVRPEDFRRALERDFEMGGILAGQRTALTAVAGTDSCSKGRRCRLSKSVVTRGDSITFRLSRPAPLFLLDLADLYPIPPGIARRDVGTKPVPGTGPYTIESYVPGRQLKLVRNPHFRVWSEAAQPDGFADEILLRIGSHEKGSLAAVSQGKADVFPFVPPRRVPGLKARYAGQVHEVPERATTFLFLNTKRPPFDDVRVRRALNYAIDRRRVAELHGEAQATCQVIPPTVPGYVRYCPYTLDPRPSGEWTAPDVAKAQQLITASRTRGQKVTVWTFPYFAKESRYMVSLLRKLGYGAQLKEVKEIGRYFATISDPKTEAHSGFAGWFNTQLGFHSLETLSCDFAQNYARFCDREADRQVQRSLNLLASDPGAAVRSWARLDRRLVDQAPWVPLFTPRLAFFVSKRIGNWQYHPYYYVLLDQLWVR